MKIEISCPGKIILMGEHAVVHHRPAIVAAVNRKMIFNLTLNTENLTLNGKIKSQIPMGCGMGSSSAWSVVQAATKYALAGKTSLNKNLLAKINQLAYAQEKFYHLNPSGIDPAICTYGGILWFKKTKNGHKVFKKLQFKRLPKFVLINTGRPKETTGEMVEKVGKKLMKEKNRVNGIFDCMEEQTKIFLRALEKRNYKLIKNSIQNFETCLEDLGVVGKLAQELVREVEEMGGVAKISGGGGLTGGSGILLCYHPESHKLLSLAKKHKLEAFMVKLGNEGVRINEAN